MITGFLSFRSVMAKQICVRVNTLPFTSFVWWHKTKWSARSKLLTQFAVPQHELPSELKFHYIKELTTSQHQIDLQWQWQQRQYISRASIFLSAVWKKAFHVSKQQKKIPLCGINKRFFLCFLWNCKELYHLSRVLLEKQTLKTKEEEGNELAICIHLCLPRKRSSEVIQKENVLEVIFYESIKAVKASEELNSLKFSKTFTLMEWQGFSATPLIDLKTLQNITLLRLRVVKMSLTGWTLIISW